MNAVPAGPPCGQGVSGSAFSAAGLADQQSATGSALEKVQAAGGRFATGVGRKPPLGRQLINHRIFPQGRTMPRPGEAMPPCVVKIGFPPPRGDGRPMKLARPLRHGPFFLPHA